MCRGSRGQEDHGAEGPEGRVTQGATAHRRARNSPRMKGFHPCPPCLHHTFALIFKKTASRLHPKSRTLAANTLFLGQIPKMPTAPRIAQYVNRNFENLGLNEFARILNQIEPPHEASERGRSAHDARIVDFCLIWKTMFCGYGILYKQRAEELGISLLESFH